LRHAYWREFCENALIQLFNDSSKEVRSQAAKCFWRFEEEQLGEYVSLVEAFIESPAFATYNHNLIHALEETTAKLPDATYRVCDRFLEVVGLNAADIRTRAPIDANSISKLLVRVYSENKDSKFKSSCLDLIDHIAQMEAFGLTEALTQYER
ncbi:MAG: hypothetical protein F6K09_07955, partial [Merismopedia sp. SIO2A8]|nr:hypothetical protein [Merismopedia sp. SIO2A8]